ncbi:hypothetical protein DM860_015001 [Cuscuta australis]|uniref:Uncharacterized protein n=1 Tax=Cuscuta australis TaxID=267555 RepID=A0A328DFL5_9ASTE|nr:hypothetical protein DM860_015001 [Cuscuta australis]
MHSPKRQFNPLHHPKNSSTTVASSGKEQVIPNSTSTVHGSSISSPILPKVQLTKMKPPKTKRTSRSMRAIPSLKKTEFSKQTAQWSMLFENGSTEDHDLPTAALGGSPMK